MRTWLLSLLGWILSNAVFAAPFESTYRVPDSAPILVRNATILTGSTAIIESGYVLMSGGVITAVGAGDPGVDILEIAELEVVDARDRWVTPGLIDVHSHLGSSPSPSYPSTRGTNEATAPVTAEVWVEHSVWPQDPQFPLALAGGVTVMQILPGSANLIGGRGVTLKNVSARSVMEMKFPGAPHGLKMACGENPQRVYGTKKVSPSTRMGNVAGYREAWIKAVKYREEWQDYEASLEKARSNPDKEPGKKPKRSLQKDTLVGVLNGEILVHNHCYRADEMAVMMEISREFGYHITAFHHGVEAYKIADLLRENETCAAVWADWGRFKLESYDAVSENVALIEKAGACAVVHSDSAWGIQRLNQEAAKALAAGRRMGLAYNEADAIKWITRNPAKALGILDRTGTLEQGKMADLVIWDQNPFSVYTKALSVYIDGKLRFDRGSGLRHRTDFELGHRAEEL